MQFIEYRQGNFSEPPCCPVNYAALIQRSIKGNAVHTKTTTVTLVRAGNQWRFRKPR
jgi:hypothetical protein